MLVPKPIAAKAVTIKNLLVLLIMLDATTGMQPTLFKIANNRKPPMNQGIIFTRFTFRPLFAAFNSFCFIRVPIYAKTKTVGIMAIVLVSFTIVAKSPAISENAYPEATTLAVSFTDVPAQIP